ncbi:DinB family protein [Alicyclobacillus dauci]|uniref:DinB family protein n=1 Tax=Alicyclobacillus dauci TaxID=1475485 RepID=UPI0038992AB8
MDTLSLLKDLSQVRRYQLAQIDGLSIERRTVIPQGFRNHLHWQLGHIVAETDNFLFNLTGKQELPTIFRCYFANGTSPKEWAGDPPSWEELTNLLLSQCHHVRHAFESGNCESTLPLAHHLYHEWCHAGIINAMTKLV